MYCRETLGPSGVGCDDVDEDEQPDDLISDDEVGFGRGGR